MTDGRTVSASCFEMSRVMQPPDANALGNVHGGAILRLMDEAAGVAARRHCRTICVTAAIDNFSFLGPVHVGDLVTVKASLTWAGRSSMEVGVRVEAEAFRTGEVRHTGSGYIVYVAIGESGCPTPVPPLIPETDEDRRRMAEAEERQRLRLKHKKMSHP